MAYVDWKIKGPKIASCSCDYGCPCEFNGAPTHGLCEGLEAHLIEEGWFGDTRLDGLVIAARYRWPGAVHKGGGIVQGVIDERASDAQREALFKILDGEEQEPTTIFNIYGSTIEKEFDPVFSRIEFACDLEKGTGGFSVPKVMDMELEPIRNPVTGAPHPAKIVLPTGFEFRSGDMASGTFNGQGDIAFDRKDSYGVLTYVAYGPYGIIEAESSPAHPPQAHA
ncbi:MAG: DUF1326 domain-containing protein [Hyphomicrobiales bacterium]|nr:DUF1326 domain-containing protein [Hyphomicrobiales bacterium]